MPLPQIEDLAETRIAQKISQLPGVGLVSINGGQRPAVRIQANLQALAADGLNIDDLRTTIANANSNAPKGNFDGATRAIRSTTMIRFNLLATIATSSWPTRTARPCICLMSQRSNRVRKTTSSPAGNGTIPAILLNVQRQPGANVIAVADRIKAMLPQIEAGLPGSVRISLITDRTTTIRASVADVELELGLAVALVVLVIFAFLLNIPATIIPSLSVPLSLVGTFAAMYLLGFSLNNLSLMALTIAAGFVVDDAIVMIENISRYLEAGEPPLQAA